jgi:hypothetical protein
MKEAVAVVDLEDEEVTVDMVEDVEVTVDMVADVEVVGLVVITLMMRIRSLVLERLKTTVLSKEITLQRDVTMVDQDLPIAVVVVEVSAMAKLVKKDVLEEHLNAAVELAEEMNSNVKVLDVVTGEQKLTNLPR